MTSRVEIGWDCRYLPKPERGRDVKAETIAAVFKAFSEEGYDLGWLRLRVPGRIEPFISDQGEAIVIDLSRTPIPLSPDIPLLGDLRGMIGADINRVTIFADKVVIAGEGRSRFGFTKEFVREMAVTP